MTDDSSLRRPYNAAVDFIDGAVTRSFGAKLAFIDPDSTLTYSALQEKTCRFANALLSLGLEHEGRVAMIMHDTVDFPVAFWGAIRAGIVVIPLNTLLKTHQYAYALADSRVTALCISASLLETVQPAFSQLPRLKHVIVVGKPDGARTQDSGVQWHDFNTLIATASAGMPIAPTLSDEVAFWLYTSGSTGNPKGVKHVHTSLMATAKCMGQGVVSIASDDVVFSAAKLFFAYGLGNAMSFPLSVGATAILLPGRPTPEAVFEVIAKHRPTVFYGVPTLYASLLASKAIGRGAGSDRLRVCISAGEALPAHIGERWHEIVGTEILDGIGSTEMLNTFLSNRKGDVRFGSSGKPVPGYDAKVVDETGREVEPEEVGELVIRGPSAGEGYWNHREKSQRTFCGEWVYTGDKYRRDADGYFYCCGRTDDVFKVSGMWVSPFEIEAALTTHEAVLEAAVIGKEDADGLTKPKAFIVLKSGYAPSDGLTEDLKRHVKEHAGLWKYPRWIDCRSDLPKTATGKIQRFLLREEETKRAS